MKNVVNDVYEIIKNSHIWQYLIWFLTKRNRLSGDAAWLKGPTLKWLFVMDTVSLVTLNATSFGVSGKR